MTAHINANPGDFADTVIMPGDPLRAQYIAQTYLTDARCVCNARNMLGFTGHYKGERISVMSHGMGIPSISIYAHELINDFAVKRMIRVGTCGAIDVHHNMSDVIVATGAGTSSSSNRDRFSGYDYAAVPDFDLLRRCWSVAHQRNISTHFGNIFTNDLLYDKPEAMLPALKKMNILAVEMETSALYAIAAQYRAQALSLLTACIFSLTGEEPSAEESQATVDNMIELALETAIYAD
ncbi:purine nucleoside phosphorylase [[Pantoea] beijingensis]|uniref:Purine nucleoside phosphorylase DeoD-type n=1 Tax=[Pantoea] beijingensis TaxID=1324864 RepID=A0A443IDU4_9GAMM|nr:MULTISPECIES: purine-nucleoside phosphorylase [Erwiniaceae]RWR02223.1 purine nucleoside phosphorylase [[Pantoea] beijingensis]